MTRQAAVCETGHKGVVMSSGTNAESNNKADTVVSVRFAAEEVNELKRLADARKGSALDSDKAYSSRGACLDSPYCSASVE